MKLGNTDRNKKIAIAILNEESVTKVAKRHNLSFSSCSAITNAFCEKADNKLYNKILNKDKGYATISSLRLYAKIFVKKDESIKYLTANASIWDIPNLSIKTLRALNHCEIITVRDLTKYDPNMFQKMPLIGKYAMREISNALENISDKSKQFPAISEKIGKSIIASEFNSTERNTENTHEYLCKMTRISKAIEDEIIDNGHPQKEAERVTAVLTDYATSLLKD